MPQHFLEAAQVRAAFEQVCRESVPQYVRRKVVENSRFPAAYLDRCPESLSRHPGAARRNEKKRRLPALQQCRATLFNISPDHPESSGMCRNDALFVAFACNSQQPQAHIHTGELQVDQLTDP